MLQQPTNCLSIFDHFVGLALKGLSTPMYLYLEVTVETFSAFECV